jgi:hypothetical protein
MRRLLFLCCLGIALGLTPSARADNFERFTVTGVLVNGNADTISGGFIVDETTHQVASVNLFVVSDNLPKARPSSISLVRREFFRASQIF